MSRRIAPLCNYPCHVCLPGLTWSDLNNDLWLREKRQRSKLESLRKLSQRLRIRTKSPTRSQLDVVQIVHFWKQGDPQGARRGGGATVSHILMVWKWLRVCKGYKLGCAPQCITYDDMNWCLAFFCVYCEGGTYAAVLVPPVVMTLPLVKVPRAILALEISFLDVNLVVLASKVLRCRTS